MEPLEIHHYRDFLRKYAENSKLRRPGFSLGAWAKALGLKSTSSLTKVLAGEREAGPELLEKLVRYFKFSELEEAQFRNLVTISKLKENVEVKEALASHLLLSGKSKSLNRRMMQMEHDELLETYLPLALRECTRLGKMTFLKLRKLFKSNTEGEIKKALEVLTRLKMVSKDPGGNFAAVDEHLQTAHEIESQAFQNYHQSVLKLAQEKLQTVELEAREFQSLVLLLDQNQLPAMKKKIREFFDSLELAIPSAQVNQVYQVQLHLVPLTPVFENNPNPNLKNNQEKK